MATEVPNAADDPVLVEVVSGSFVESRHRGAVAVADRLGRLVMACGDVDGRPGSSDLGPWASSLVELVRGVAGGTEPLPFVGVAPPLAQRLAAATDGAADVHILPCGVCVAALPNLQLVIALRINDAAPRAIGAAMFALLRKFGAVPDSHLGDFAALSAIGNAKGEVIATVRARIGLDG